LTVYLASPSNQLQAHAAADMPVLLSFSEHGKPGRAWIEDYAPAFSRVLIDSGAYSELTTGKPIDLDAYMGWCERWVGKVDAIAGLDNISGDWRRSLANFERFPIGFPTFHDTDPDDLLDDLIPMARDRGGWIGLGLKPPRGGKENWVRDACDRIPDDIHVHGFALREYAHVARLDSIDSTNWWRDALDIRVLPLCRHLTYGETLEIVVKRYKRETRITRDRTAKPTPLFEGLN
jgi:hypothetical protein